jgi:hypothetical protein
MNGATVAQLNAIFGWTGSKMASLYTQSADRARLSREAMNKLLGRQETTKQEPLCPDFYKKGGLE